MFSKLFCLLIILFVLFESSKPTQRMLSIFGDINFIHYNAALALGDVLGFVYDDASNGFFVATSCTAGGSATYLSVDAKCKVTAKAAMESVAATLGFNERVSSFPAAGNNVNVMVGISATSAIKIVEKSEITGTPALATVTATGDSITVTSSTLFCNEKDEAATKKLIATATTTAGTVVTVTYPTTVNNTLYDSINKCYFEAVQSTNNAVLGAATFILIVTDIDQRPVAFITSKITDYAVLNQHTINDSESIGTVIGTINGTTSCPTNDMLTFANGTTSSSCNGNITTKVTLDGCTTPLVSFEYGSKNYTMLVQHVDSNNAAVQCGSTQAASNFKCSNMSIGLLLVFMLKTLRFSWI